MRETVSITVHAAADQVWSVMSDIARWPEWTPTVTSVERLDGGPLGVGSRARIRQPKLATLVYTVTDLQPPRSFTWSARSPGIRVVADHRIEPQSDGSVTVTLSVEQTGLLAPVVGRIMGDLTRRYITTEAERLKSRCESMSRTPAA